MEPDLPDKFGEETAWDIHQREMEREAPLPAVDRETYRAKAIEEYGKSHPGDILWEVFSARHQMTPQEFVTELVIGTDRAEELLDNLREEAKRFRDSL